MILTRIKFNADGILGRLLDADYMQVAATLEHSYDGKPKLQAGGYRCVRGWHSLPYHPEPFETFEVTQVPGHTGILFHTGNWNEDSNGCILLGQAALTDADGRSMVTESRVTFKRFMLDLDGVESFSLMVEDGIVT